MSFALRRFGAAFLLCMLAAAADAQQGLTLAEAQGLALSRSQQLAASDAAASSLRDQAVAAGQMPDPVLKLGIENVPLSGPDRLSLSRDFMTMRRIGVMQEWTRRDKRLLRVERVERELDRVEAERQVALAEVQRETALAWISAAYWSAIQELLRSQLAESKLQVDAAELAYRQARGSQADVFAARAALVNLEDRVRDVERQQRNARVMLARWVGPAAATRPLAGSINWREADGERFLSRRHLQIHPNVAVLLAQAEALEVEVKQAQANAKPDWTVEASYSRRGPAYSDMVSIGVSIPWQIDRPKRQDREFAARVHLLAQAEAKVEDALRAEEAMVRTLLNDWATGKQRLNRLTSDLLPVARNRTEAALTAYRGAKGDLGSVLAARRDEIDVRLQLLNLELEVARLWAQLTYLVADPAIAPIQEGQP
jgi:outer membrane protein TolC